MGASKTEEDPSETLLRVSRALGSNREVADNFKRAPKLVARLNAPPLTEGLLLRTPGTMPLLMLMGWLP